MNTAIARSILLLLVLTTGACREDAGVTRLKLAHNLDINHPVHMAMVKMVDELDTLSGGTMAIDIYPGGQLGSERDVIELLQIGSLAMTKVSASPLEGFLPEMKVFSIPYIFRDNDHYWQVLNSDIGRDLLLTPERIRLRGLGYYDAGSRSFYATEKPIHSPADLDGMKIRVMKSQTAVDTVNSLGGSATPISWGELYTALQQGVVDGAENNPPTFYASRHFEVARYYTLDEHSAIPDILLISLHVWNSLPAQQQQWLQQAMDQSVLYQRQLWKTKTGEALQAVEAAGVQIIRPDKSAFRERVVAMHNGYRDDPVWELLTAIKEFPSTPVQTPEVSP